MIPSLRRMYALVLRQVYLIRNSPPRLLAYMFWPTMQMIIWGYMNKFLYQQAGLATLVFSTLLGANLMLSFFERTNVQIMWGFLEDVWARNIGNVMITPIKPVEMLIGYVLNGLIAVVVGTSSAIILAYFMFDYSLFSVGIYLIPLMINLIISGWCIGLLLIAMLFRYGASGEHFGWMAAFVLIPFAAVYYPVSVLPQWAQYLAFILPPSHVFEGLRYLIKTHEFDWALFNRALLLNIGWLFVSFVVFLRQLQKARQRGGLLSMGE